MLKIHTPIADFDAELMMAIQKERQRQENHIELIASENYVSPRVLEMQGSLLTNKYAEGYPGKRYYGGCEFVDVAENLAIARAKQLFLADYANVQPHCGSQANAAAYMAMIKPGDTVLAMSLTSGGHLTHGSPVNFSGQYYHIVSYEVDAKTGLINYDEIRDLAKKHRPKLIVAGFSAYSRIVDWACISQIAQEISAFSMADIAHVAGLIATGLYPSPIAHMDVVTSTTHKTLRGPRGGLILAKDHDTLPKKLNAAIFPGSQGGPLMHVIAAKATAFKEALMPDFVDYQQQVLKNAKKMTEVMMQRGFKVVSDGTDNHLFLIDLTNKAITGQKAESALDAAHITANKNTVPGETRSPFITSGLRIGTPAITTRGMKTAQAEQIAHWMSDLLDHINDESYLAKIKAEVQALCAQFPVYPHQSTTGA